MASKTKFLSPKSKPDLSSINSCGEVVFPQGTDPQAGWNDKGAPGETKGMNLPRDDRKKWADMREKVADNLIIWAAYVAPLVWKGVRTEFKIHLDW